MVQGLLQHDLVFVMANLPIAPVERIIKDAGAERVSGPAAKALAEVLEDHGTEIATRAIKLARHAGRKTVTGQDMKLAV
jgi:histone H3/H4